jgi:phosphoserine phosphatase
MTKILYVRHGETDWNKENRIQGQSDTKLNKLGKEQAKKIAERLKNEKIDAIYTSTLSRAIETAKEINKYHKLKIQKSKELNEINFGVFEGKTWEEIEEKYPKTMGERKKDVYYHKFSKGENYDELWKRIYKKILEIEKKHPKENVLIVGHGGAKITLMMNFLKKTYYEVRKYKIKNTSITIFDIEKGKVEFHTINDHAHLT